MKQTFSLITLFFVASTLQAQTSTNPVYLNYDSNLDWATYISATGSVSNQPSMFFHLPYVGTTGNAVFEWDADDSGTRKTIYRFETSSDRIFEINGWNDGNSSDLWFGDDNDNKFYIADGGRVGIGTNSPEEDLHVEGTATIRGNIGFADDNHWKTGEHTLEITNSDSGDVVLSFHREGYSNASIRHSSQLGLTFSGNGSANSSHFHIQREGNVGIGTDAPGNKLEVNGTIRSKEIVVEATNWPDYVFEEDYDLPTLSEIEAFIKANKHLPEVPSAKEMEASGISLGEMNTLLLKKIEELTLHTIEQERALENKQELIDQLELRISTERSIREEQQQKLKTLEALINQLIIKVELLEPKK